MCHIVPTLHDSVPTVMYIHRSNALNHHLTPGVRSSHVSTTFTAQCLAAHVLPHLEIFYIPYIPIAEKFGYLASSLKFAKFNSSPNYSPFNLLLAAALFGIVLCK